MAKGKLYSVAALLVLSAVLLLISCSSPSGTSTQSQTSSSSLVPTSLSSSSVTSQLSTVPVAIEANWWDKLGKPTYGGTFTDTENVSNINLNLADPLTMGAGCWWCETLFAPDWTVDPSVLTFDLPFVPVKYYQGLLAQSWEQTDPATITVHLRKNIHWQNKAPVNGREFTADDVVYNYDMQLGTGNGFDKPNPVKMALAGDIAQVVATDKYTVVFKLKIPSIWAQFRVFDPVDFPSVVAIMAPEQVKAGLADPATFTDWHNAGGTGPWLLTDFVASTSMTLSKNPDYWGYDERYPQNRLPYIDTYKCLSIPDVSTELAAMRTGKIDYIPSSPLITPQQAANLAKTNPEIIQLKHPFQGPGIDLRCDTTPFTDIRVRQALQLAINIPAIARSVYAGTVQSEPAGLVSPLYKGYTTPYNQWPKELQDEYSYNPTKAKELLAEAGYPNGFSTNVVTSAADFPEVLQAAKSYFKDINVDMDIKTMDRAALYPYLMAGKNDQMGCAFGATVTAMVQSPYEAVTRHSSMDPQNFTHNNDVQYDALVNKVAAAATIEEAQQTCTAADMYNLTQHWTIQFFGINFQYAIQPWVKGFASDPQSEPQFWIARWWIDQSLKK